MRESELSCPRCGAGPGEPCHLGVTHDTRIIKAMFTDPPGDLNKRNSVTENPADPEGASQ